MDNLNSFVSPYLDFYSHIGIIFEIKIIFKLIYLKNNFFTISEINFYLFFILIF